MMDDGVLEAHSVCSDLGIHVVGLLHNLCVD